MTLSGSPTSLGRRSHGQTSGGNAPPLAQCGRGGGLACAWASWEMLAGLGRRAQDADLWAPFGSPGAPGVGTCWASRGPRGFTRFSESLSRAVQGAAAQPAPPSAWTSAQPGTRDLCKDRRGSAQPPPAPGALCPRLLLDLRLRRQRVCNLRLVLGTPGRWRVAWARKNR